MLQPLVSPVSSSSMLLGMDPRQSYSNALCSGHSEATVRAAGLREIPRCLGGWAAMSSAMMNSGAELKETTQHWPSDTAEQWLRKLYPPWAVWAQQLIKAAQNYPQFTRAGVEKTWAGPIHTERVRKGRSVWLHGWWSHIPEQFFPESGLESCNWCTHPEWVL